MLQSLAFAAQVKGVLLTRKNLGIVMDVADAGEVNFGAWRGK